MLRDVTILSDFVIFQDQVHNFIKFKRKGDVLTIKVLEAQVGVHDHHDQTGVSETPHPTLGIDGRSVEEQNDAMHAYSYHLDARLNL